MKLSIVSTLYNSSLYLEEFYKRIISVAGEVTSDYEIILVNDGSPDDSLAKAVNLSINDEHVIVIDLSRNFGHHKAMMTGLVHCQGDYVFLIDSDLEEEPEWLMDFFNQLTRENCDVVYGAQIKRKGNWFERQSGGLFYIFFNLLTNLNLPKNIVTARLMTRGYVDALVQFDEREVFMAGLWYTAGFDQRPQFVRKLSNSPTTYTLKHKFSLFINSVSSFSSMPLIGIFYVGIFIFFVASSYAGWLILRYLIFGKTLIGWTSTITSIWLLGGLTISIIGIIGIYLAKMFSEIKRRPYTIIKKIYGK